MRFAIKLLISVCVIAFCAQIGRKLPTLAGLIAVMPLTGLIVLIWLYMDNPGNFNLMTEYTKSALWGILPTILFFLTAFLCFHKKAVFVDSPVRKLCGLADCGVYSPVAAQVNQLSRVIEVS